MSMTEQVMTILTQFGAAGLIGLLWLFERRHAASRERQLDEAHKQVINRERELHVLLDVVKENTRAINSLESSQRRLIAVLSGSRHTPGTTDARR